MNAAETHETFHRESGMRYHFERDGPDSRSNWGFFVPENPRYPCLYPYGSRKQLVDPKSRLLLHRRDDVRIAVQSDGNAAVPEHL